MSFSTTRLRAAHTATGGKSMTDMFGGRINSASTVSRFQAGTPAFAGLKNAGSLWGSGSSLPIVRRPSNRLI